MQKVVIYPGRFQPMLAHHAEVYKQLQANYPDADVYIGTSNKVEGEKSPFNFEEKVRIASAHGIPGDKILQATRPYHKDDYDFDEKSTVIIFAVGEKDLDRFPFNNVDPETNLDMTVRGETRPKYYQPLSTFDAKNPVTMDERGYITLAPTVKTGDEVASASAFRERFKNSPDEESAKDVFVDQFGEYNDEVFNLIYDKIVRKQMSEELNTLKKLAGLNEGPAVDFDDYQTISKKDAKAASERPEKAAASDPESVDFQSPDPEKFHSTIKKSIANRMDSDDVNDPEAKKDAFMKELLKSPETLLGEINARLAVDDNGLAVSDRLSDIMNKLSDGGLAGLEEDDKKFVIKLVANALKNMELVKDPKADQEKAEYEKELEDSVDLSDIRAEYGIKEDENDQFKGTTKDGHKYRAVADDQDYSQYLKVFYGDGKYFRIYYDDRVTGGKAGGYDPKGIETNDSRAEKVFADLPDDFFDKYGSEGEHGIEDIIDMINSADESIDEQSADQDVGSDAMNTFVKYRDEVEKNYGEDGLKYYYNVWQEVKRQRGAKANAGEAYRLTVQKFSGQELTKPLDMKSLEPAESFDPSAEQSREEEAYDQLIKAYEDGGEEALAKELSMSIEEFDNEISEFGVEHNLHADDDRDEIIQRYIEDTVDNADWKDHGEQDFDPADAEMESIQEGGDCHHCKGDDPDCEHCDGSGYVQFDDDPNEPDEDEIEKELGKMLKLAGMK